MKFSDCIGQRELALHLMRSADGGRVSHAQIFTGASGRGTLPLALAYAQYLNCTGEKHGDSCGSCPSCVKMEALAHPDLHFVFPVNSASKSSSGQKPGSDAFLPQWRQAITSSGGYFDEQEWYRAIEIENQQGIISRAEADEVMRKLSFKSFEGKYKTVVVWLPERMRAEAANALLKILEEPWERTLFLLVSEEPRFLLQTILSRVQEVAVPCVSAEDIERWLVEKHASGLARATATARLAGGDLIAARRLTAEESDGPQQEYFELFKQLMRFSFNDKHMELIEWADVVCGLGREEQKRFLAYSARLLRDSYMMGAGMQDISYLSGAEEEFCLRFAPFIGNHNIEALTAEMTLAWEQVARNGNPRIIFPHFALAVSKMIVRV